MRDLTGQVGHPQEAAGHVGISKEKSGWNGWFGGSPATWRLIIPEPKPGTCRRARCIIR